MYDIPDMPFDEPTPLRVVDNCKNGCYIWEGQEYFDVQGDIYCKECMEEYRHFAD